MAKIPVPRSRFRFVLLIAFVALLPSFSTAQVRPVDPTFNPVPSSPLLAAQQIVQPDGKVVVWSTSLVVDGVAKGNVARLNADGSLDPTFTFGASSEFYLTNLFLLPDGRIIAAGSENGLAKMLRLNQDGSVDNSFASGFPTNGFGTSFYTVITAQPDGKIFASRRQSNLGYNELTLYRFNQDGSVDNTFTPVGYGTARFFHPFITGLIVLPDGRLYLSDTTTGAFISNAQLRRFNANGAPDATWETPSFGGSSGARISAIDVQADGAIVAAGNFDLVNGLAKVDFVRLLPAGNVDTAFNPPAFIEGNGVKDLSTGKILISSLVDTSGVIKIFRLNPDGSIDNAFVIDPAVQTVSNPWVVDSSNRIIFLARITGSLQMVRLLPDGAVDPSFNANVAAFGRVFDLARLADGRIYVSGEYTRMNGVARPSLSRVNPDGSLDTAFDPGTGFDGVPTETVAQPDGKLIAIGPFSTYNGVGRPWIARINTNGTLDTGFAPAVASLEGISLQTDGRILISGSFGTVNGTTRTAAARLNANGTLDETFNVVVGGTVYRILQLPDGKIVIGGGFTGVNGFNRSNLVRLNADGSLDQSFNASVGGVVGMWVQPDGKILISNGSSLFRRNADGSADATFTPPVFATSSSSDTRIYDVMVLTDGSLLVGGRFDTVGTMPRRNLVRLSPNGSPSTLFVPRGVDAAVRTIVGQADAKSVIGGDFTRVEDIWKPGIARINFAPFRTDTPFDFNGDGRADFVVYRPSTGVWYQLFSNGDPYAAPAFGLAGDIPVPADFDADGKTDTAIYRPSTGDWWYKSSVNGAQVNVRWGATGDIPRPSDFDGDGKADFVLFRPSSNQWLRLGTTAGVQPAREFGVAGDVPLIGDFDGDNKSDLAVFRPSTGDWWYAASASSGAFRSVHWGQTGDIPAPADYDGDGKTDFAIFRPSDGGWYILNSGDASIITRNFGLGGDRPVAADYDGDGKADIAVFRPSTGIWYLLQSTAGFGGLQWGVASDVAVPNAFSAQ
jgi:uncharacterized delta-60 repeat protein